MPWSALTPDFEDAPQVLREQGFCVLPAAGLRAATATKAADLAALHAFWSDLPPDPHLRDGGHYRFRRHASYVIDAPASPAAHATAVPHRAHWQPTTYNALHGGLLRWFEPLQPALAASPTFTSLLAGLGRLFAAAAATPPTRWHIEAHPFRIDTSDGLGRPTPEGAHRDGVDYVAVVLMGRHAIRGGETRVFEADGPRGMRFTLAEPWSVLLLDDERVIHESTPIQPDGTAGHRDTLVLTYRAAGFMSP